MALVAMPVVVVVVVVLGAAPARAWIYSEHRDITVRAFTQLEPHRRAQLQALWARAAKRLPRLCPLPLEQPAQVPPLGCVKLGDLPALAADHACSVPDLRSRLLRFDPVRRVMLAARETELELLASRSPEEHLDALAMQHLRLQRADEDYLSRAANEGWHFVRLRTSDRLEDYLRSVLSASEPTNGIALYAAYHAAAISLAARVQASGAPPTAEQAVSILLLESFALHFLQDAFAAGHVVGAHQPRERFKGTHDYYSEHGISARIWSEPAVSYHAYGDTFMTRTDLRYASRAVGHSLAQVLDALGGRIPPRQQADLRAITARAWSPAWPACRHTRVPLALESLADNRLIKAVVRLTIIPAPRNPRPVPVADQLGAYIAAGFGADATMAYGWAPQGARVQARIIAQLGLGVGVDGITTGSHESRMLLAPAAALSGGSAMRANLGVGFSLHMPYAYLPFIDGPYHLARFALHGKSAAAAMASLSGPLGIYRRHRLGRFSSVQFTLARSGTLIFYPGYETRATESSLRWELTLPFLTLTVGRAFGAPLSSSIDLRFSLHVGHTAADQPESGRESATSLGLTVGLFNDTGYYL